jgi:hypothetical protein
MNRKSLWLFLPLMLVVSGQAVGQSIEPPRVDTGCRGGFTGGGDGVSLTNQGQFVAWTQATAGSPREQRDLDIDKVAATELLAELDAIGFVTIEINQPSNMTCSITFEGHTVAWPLGQADVPEAVLAIHERLMRMGN